MSYYTWKAFKGIRSPRDFFVFLLNPLRLENEVRDRLNERPFWRMIKFDVTGKTKNYYGLFVKNQKRPLIMMKRIIPYTTSYLVKLGEMYSLIYFNNRKKYYMEMSEHGDTFGVSSDDDIQRVPMLNEKYNNDLKMQLKIINSCEKDLKKYAGIFWRWHLIEKYLNILSERKKRINLKKKKLLESV